MKIRLIRGGALYMAVVACLLIGVTESRAQSVPAPWVGRDIGSPAVAGRSSASGGTLSVTGSGRDIGNASDQFHFVYQPISGDADVRVRVNSFTFADWTAKAGLMIREGLTADSRLAYVFRYPSGGVSFRYRNSAGATVVGTNEVASASPVWLRLVRQGNLFTAYRSSDGSNWTNVSSQTLSMPSDVYVGLAVTSHDGQASATATFDNVQGVNAPTSSTLPTPWAKQDVGSPAVAGTASAAGGIFTVTGAGTDIWDTADQFQFVNQRLTGDVEVIARVNSLQYADPWSKAGVMIRESVDGGSRHAALLLTGTQGSHFQRRIQTSGTSYDQAGPTGSAPAWVRLVREGNLFTAYRSSDGSNWVLVGTDTITMSSTVYVGLAVTSHNASATATATFSNVAARGFTSTGNRPPTVSISSPSDGATFSAGATFVLTATASDTDGTISKVDLYEGSRLLKSDRTTPYSVKVTLSSNGNYAYKAVATDSDGTTTTSALVNVTVGGTTNQPPAVSLTNPSTGASFTAPASITMAATASDTDGTVARVDFYQGSTLLYSDTTSPYGYTWTNVAAGTYSVTAVARDDDGATRTSSAASVTVNSATNQAPNVSLTSPTSGATFTAGANIALSATASDTDGTVARVEFYRGTTLIGTDTSSPYSVMWSGATSGSYSLTARAFDDDGASRNSTALSITVNTAPNQLPTVSITSPIAGQSFTAPASVTISAAASDTDGTISGVDFYVGSQLIATDTTSPYSASWTNVAAGSYSLTAVARDNSGGTRTSTAIAVTATAVAATPTTVVFTASADNATNVTSYTVAIYRSADPVTGSPVATSDLGKPTPVSGDISVNISTLVDPLPAGTYKAVVRATGPGGTTASAPSSNFTK